MRSKFLIASAISIFPVTLIAFTFFPTDWDKMTTFLAAMIFYWLIILASCIILIAGNTFNYKKIFIPQHRPKALLSYYALAFTPLPAVFFVAFLPNVFDISLQNFVVILVISLINGLLEEFYWRGLYLVHYKNNLVTSVGISTVFFTLWHISLFILNGLVYHGNYLGLVGGAIFMGVVWSYVSQKTGNIFYLIIAHFFVNIFAFTGLFVENNF